MPEMDGYDFIRSYRREANTPIIVLTAKLDETDKVVGLELGADDYITKPFGMRELTARRACGFAAQPCRSQTPGFAGRRHYSEQRHPPGYSGRAADLADAVGV